MVGHCIIMNELILSIIHVHYFPCIVFSGPLKAIHATRLITGHRQKPQ